jgi:hypothetical protein
MEGKYKIDYADRFGNWHYRAGGFELEQAAIEAAKNISEELKAITRVVDALSGKVRSLVEVVIP